MPASYVQLHSVHFCSFMPASFIMNLFISLAVVLFGSFVSGQAATSFPSFPTAPIPTSPSQPAAAALISNIPACWLPCVGGAIKEVCPSDDSWACACNNYFNSNTTEFVQLAAYDTSCQSCPQNVGPSDGAEQGTYLQS